jgi:ribosome-dependent ATPase
MLVLGYGISMDVEDLSFAVLDRDRSPVSRDYIENISGSRYFRKHAEITSPEQLDQRMRSGEISLAIEIPPGFGVDLKRGRNPQVAMWIDGAMPFRAETIGGYMEGMHLAYLSDASIRTMGYVPTIVPVNMVSRYRFNQDFQSIHAVAPAVIPILLMFIPSILAALSVVREKELGSIVNLYASPATRLEFLLGKQVPYIVVSLASFLVLAAVTTWVFQVPIKGSLTALLLGTLLYVTVSTSIGLLVSTFTRTQVAALAGTAIITLLATVSFSGLIDPVSSLEGPGRLIGENWPATYFIDIVRGIYTKGLGLEQLAGQFWHLAAFIPVFLAASALFLRKQGR